MNESNLENIWNIIKKLSLQIADKISSEYKCTICKNILINACNAKCGCRFCLDCIKEYLKDGKKQCPGQSQLCDIEKIDFDTDIQINQLINIKISKLSFNCPNIGCQSPVELNTIEDHLRICENQPHSCPYSILGCEENKIEKHQIRDHLTMEIYSHTKILINWMSNSRNEMELMKTEMEKLRLNNEELKEKMRSDGEGMKKIFRDLEKREKENREEIEILNEEMCFLKNCNRSMKDELKAVKEEHGEQICQLKTQVKNQSQEIETLKQKCQHAEIKCDEIQRQGETRCIEIRQQTEKSRDMQIKLDEILQTNAALKRQSTITDKSVSNIGKIVHKMDCLEFSWEVENWSKEVLKAQHCVEEEIFSKPFFSHPKGYKMCLSAWAGANLGIDFCIMKGPFDNSLRWPFDRDVVLCLMNKKTGLAHAAVTIACSKHPNEAALQKPTNDTRNKGFGHYFMHNPQISSFEISHNLDLCSNDRILIKFSSKPSEHIR